MTEATQRNKPWLKNYPKGVPENIDISAYSSLAALFEDSFQRFAERKAYLYMGQALTFAQLDVQSHRSDSLPTIHSTIASNLS